MTTGYEVTMYRDIQGARRALERIASALERLADQHDTTTEPREQS